MCSPCITLRGYCVKLTFPESFSLEIWKKKMEKHLSLDMVEATNTEVIPEWVKVSSALPCGQIKWKFWLEGWDFFLGMHWFQKSPEPILRTPRSPRSKDLKIQNNENSKLKLVKTRWNPKFGLSDLKNDLLTSTNSEGLSDFFFKNYII